MPNTLRKLYKKAVPIIWNFILNLGHRYVLEENVPLNTSDVEVYLEERKDVLRNL